MLSCYEFLPCVTFMILSSQGWKIKSKSKFDYFMCEKFGLRNRMSSLIWVQVACDWNFFRLNVETLHKFSSCKLQAAIIWMTSSLSETVKTFRKYFVGWARQLVLPTSKLNIQSLLWREEYFFHHIKLHKICLSEERRGRNPKKVFFSGMMGEGNEKLCAWVPVLNVLIPFFPILCIICTSKLSIITSTAFLWSVCCCKLFLLFFSVLKCFAYRSFVPCIDRKVCEWSLRWTATAAAASKRRKYHCVSIGLENDFSLCHHKSQERILFALLSVVTSFWRAETLFETIKKMVGNAMNLRWMRSSTCFHTFHLIRRNKTSPFNSDVCFGSRTQKKEISNNNRRCRAKISNFSSPLSSLVSRLHCAWNVHVLHGTLFALRITCRARFSSSLSSLS